MNRAAPKYTDKILILNESDIVASGQWRACYRHPLDSGKCIKVVITQSFSHLKKKTVGNIYRKLLAPKFSRKDSNDREWLYYDYLRAKGPVVNDCVAKIHGFVTTSSGRGLVAELITDYDGELSLTFEQMISQRRAWPDNFKLLVDDFCSVLIEHDVRLYDLNLGNLALQQVQKDVFKIKAIDVKGAEDSKSFLRLDRYFPLLAQAKMKRRIKRLKEKLGLQGD